MTEEKGFETYLSISKNKYAIYLIDKNNYKNLYKSEIYFNDNFQNYDNLIKFLDNNIFKIEKFIGKFIKNIYLIIENQQILNLAIGVKKRDYNQILNKNYLKNILFETKDLFKKSYQDQKIMHMFINNYLVKDKNFLLDNDLKIKDFSLVINFISIPNNLSNNFEKILKRYQININRYLHEGYVKKYFEGQEIEFSVMVCKILKGFNENEVQLVPKSEENTGFFEKFFQLFS